MRRPYSIPCRFLRDSDIESTVKWVEARPDALTLGRTNIITSQDWELDRGLLPVEVGEQEGRRKFAIADAPVGLGRGHVCGTDEDFNEGGSYEPDLPPVEYSALGWPLCCDPPRRVSGGPGASGRTAVVVHRRANYGGAGASGRSPVTVTPAIHLYGGAGASGRTGAVVVPWVDSAAGGMMIGGAVPDVYTPGPPTPGTDCVTAGAVELDVTYTHAFPPPGQSDWWRFAMPAPGDFHVITTGVDGVGTRLVHDITHTCSLIGTVVPIVDGPPCWEYAVSPGFIGLLVFSRTSGATSYTFRISAGPC
jgi:hypothetical protein